MLRGLRIFGADFRVFVVSGGFGVFGLFGV